MPVARRTGVVRRTAANNVEPATDTTKTKVVIDEETEADITEQIGAKTVSYKAKVKGIDNDEETEETENDDFDFENDDDTSFASNRLQIETVPKSKIDVLFDALEEFAGDHPYFYAQLTRQPDALGDRFFVPCNSEMPLGVFQFGSQDRFTFMPEIQKLAGSGGRFNIAVFGSDQKPLRSFVRFEFNRGGRTPVTEPIGIRNLMLPNPAPKTEAPQNNTESQLAQILSQMQASQQESTRMIIEAIQRANAPREKSTFESAIEQKIMRDILEPPKPQTNEIEKTLATLLTMPAMAEGLARRMFPENPPPDEPQGFFDKLISNPEIVQKAIDTGGNVIANLTNLAAMKMQSDAMQKAEAIPQPPTNPQPQPQAIPQPQPAPQISEAQQNELMAQQHELITEILIELETDNPITLDNPKLKELAGRFPQIYPLIGMLCKSQEFPDLLDQLGEVVSFEEHGLLDEDGDFNPRGLAVKARLKQFYELERGK